MFTWDIPGIQTILSALSTIIGCTNLSNIDNLLFINRSLTNVCFLLVAENILSPFFSDLITTNQKHRLSDLTIVNKYTQIQQINLSNT